MLKDTIEAAEGGDPGLYGQEKDAIEDFLKTQSVCATIPPCTTTKTAKKVQNPKPYGTTPA
jgi:hypothetical protein